VKGNITAPGDPVGVINIPWSPIGLLNSESCGALALGMAAGKIGGHQPVAEGGGGGEDDGEEAEVEEQAEASQGQAGVEREGHGDVRNLGSAPFPANPNLERPLEPA
jgi:hypothetical protein